MLQVTKLFDTKMFSNLSKFPKTIIDTFLYSLIWHLDELQYEANFGVSYIKSPEISPELEEPRTSTLKDDEIPAKVMVQSRQNSFQSTREFFAGQGGGLIIAPKDYKKPRNERGNDLLKTGLKQTHTTKEIDKFSYQWVLVATLNILKVYYLY